MPQSAPYLYRSSTMFRFFGLSERDALAPLLELAREKHGYDRQEWLSDLRRDAPTVVARLEQLLAREDEPAPAPAAHVQLDITDPHGGARSSPRPAFTVVPGATA